MPEKKRRVNLKEKYRKPLPITLSVDKYGNLPQVFVHNPLSWVYFWYRLASIYLRLVPKDKKVVVEASVQEDSKYIYLVHDAAGMDKLWSEGFFGKGSLSRSDPTWAQRTRRRLELDEGDMSMEENTNVRRGERRRYKQARSIFQALESKQRNKTISEAEVETMHRLKEALERAKNGLPLGDLDGILDEPKKDEGIIRKEDEELIVDGDVKNIEYLQLQNTEVFFLQWALQAVEVYDDKKLLSTRELFNMCREDNDIKSDDWFILNYVVYHHFRSLGWCVRSGIKFGCDMILYKRGPPFHHAEFAVLVIPVDGKSGWKNWEDLMSVARVVGGVRKTLIFVFVEFPDQESFQQTLTQTTPDRSMFKSLFELYRVNEVVYKRWSPARTRE